MTRRTRPAAAGTAAALLLALAGCGADPTAAEGVASLPRPPSAPAPAGPSATPAPSGPSPAPATPAPSGTPQRPQLRVDSTPEEIDRYNVAWAACLQAQGAPVGGKPMAEGSDQMVPLGIVEREPAAAYEACAHLEPLSAWELDPERNHRFAEDFREWLRCMNDRGVRVSGTPDGPMEWDTSGVSREERFRVTDECNVASYDGR